MTSPSDHDGTLRLRIKSFKDVEISVPAGSVVAHLKQQVKAALMDEEDQSSSHHDRSMRLICKGRLLLPDDHPLTDFNVRDGDVVHAVLAPKPVQNNNNNNSSSRNTHREGEDDKASPHPPRGRARRRHLIVGPGGRVTRAADESHDNSDDEDSLAAGGVGGERRGFDRLRLPNNGISDVPLSRNDVTALRLYFSRNIDRYLIQHPTTASSTEVEDPMLRRYQAEEEWMAQQGPSSEFRLNVSAQSLVMRAMSRGGGAGVGPPVVGTERDFLWGFMLGFLVGFVMLFWVWIPTGT